ncbi:MAG: histidine kinase [Gracilimonas sp.]|nr:histidine kinase [Gracilimonas sp.]
MNILDMKLRDVHELIPFRNLFKLVFGFAVSIQVIIILVNHLTGFFELNSISHFISRLIFGSILSLIATFAVVYPDLFVIKLLNEKVGWHKKVFVRVILQFFWTVAIGGIIAVVVTYISHVLNPYRDGFLINMSYNLMIFAVCNVILMIILEGWIFFIEGVKSSQRSRELESQVMELRFEMLKKQIDSHFLFNSLNVLSGLIEKDPIKAQDFIDEFSRLYRYVLESIDKRVVSVRDEINFARSYLYLQKMRYGKGLEYKVGLSSELMDGYLPPLSLQVVLENVCKHNTVSLEEPLMIGIFGKNGELVIQNNLQPKISHSRGTRTGQSNLKKRYQLLCDMEPTFKVGTVNYTATLPIIFEEK